MTATFSPRKTMLRVDQKNFPAWALFDAGLDSPGLLTLYVVAWFAAYIGWELGQTELAALGKMSLRAAQDNLKLLEQRGFLVARRENGRKYYDLALSPHVLSEFLRQGVEFQAVEKTEEAEVWSSTRVRTRGSCAPDTQNSRAGHAESAHLFKNIKEIKDMKNTPLSPLPHGLAPQTVAGSRTAERGSGESFSPLASSVPPSEASFPPGRDRAKRAASGRPSRPGYDSVDADFARLWAVWPVHQSEVPARNIFRSLARRGRLPSIQTLLDTVSRFRAEDERWQNVRFVPRLDTWLRNERWTDEPLARTGRDDASTPIQTAPPDSPDARAQISASRTALAEEREHQRPLTAETIQKLALVSPLFRRYGPKTPVGDVGQPGQTVASIERKPAPGPSQDECKQWGMVDESHQRPKKRNGKNRILSQQATDIGNVGPGLFSAPDLRGALRESTTFRQLQAILSVCRPVEVIESRAAEHRGTFFDAFLPPGVHPEPA